MSTATSCFSSRMVDADNLLPLPLELGPSSDRIGGGAAMGLLALSASRQENPGHSAAQFLRLHQKSSAIASGKLCLVPLFEEDVVDDTLPALLVEPPTSSTPTPPLG